MRQQEWLIGLIGAALLSVILSATLALAQQGNAAAESYDFVVNGVTYRVPRAFHPNAPASPQAAESISFSFWISDLAPPKFRSADLATAFWPPEPGRPSESADDFVVIVRADASGNQQTMDMLLAAVRAAARGKSDREYGLDCLRPQIGPARCFTEAGRDPAAHFTLLDLPSIAAVNTFAFSSKDGVYTTIAFPLIGMPKWAVVLCQSYTLLQRWRVSGGPPPDDCNKLPR